MPAVFPCNVIDPSQLPLEYVDIYISFLFLIRLADFNGLPMDVPNPNVDRSCEVRAKFVRGSHELRRHGLAAVWRWSLLLILNVLC